MTFTDVTPFWKETTKYKWNQYIKCLILKMNSEVQMQASICLGSQNHSGSESTQQAPPHAHRDVSYILGQLLTAKINFSSILSRHATTGCSDRSRVLHWLHFYWLSLLSVTLILIKLNISQLCCIAEHAYIFSPMVTVTRAARNRKLSIKMIGIVSLCRCVSLVVWMQH